MTRLRLFRVVAIGLLGAATTASASIDEAEDALRAGDALRAAEFVRDHVARNPSDATKPRALAILARTESDPGAAMARWDELLAVEPKGRLAAEAHWNRGLHAYSAGLYLGATEEFALLAEEFKDQFDRGRAFLWKARSQLGAEKIAESLESFREAERACRDDLDRRSAELGIAHAEFRTGNVGEALKRYDRFEREHRDDSRASSAARRAIECLRLLGREGEASTRAAHIEETYPNSFEATLVRAATREAEERERPDAPTTVEEPKGPFIVQVASLADPKNAVRLRRRVQALGFTVTLELGEGPQGPVNRIIVGPFDDRSEAQAAADSVATLGDVNPRVREAAATRSSGR
jgi:tetratricopeptide (TPR) repeat protein